MSLSIRTNVASLGAQRQLSTTQEALTASLSRLSSGFRITRAADDAAGLGISTRLESRIRSGNQAIRNANDGLSIVQSAEAGLDQDATILTRLRELAMQAASDGVGASERGFVDREAQQLISELERVAQTSEFNGVKLLDGGSRTLDFHVGVDGSANDVISFRTLDATKGSGFMGAAAFSYVQDMAANGWSDAAASTVAQSSAGGVANATAAQEAAGAAHEIFLVGMYTAGGSLFPDPVTDPALQAAGSELVAATRNGGTGGNALLAAAYGAYTTAITGGQSVSQAQDAATTAAEAAANAAGITGFNGASAGIAAGVAAAHVFAGAFAGVTGAAPSGTPAAGAARTAALAALAGAYPAPAAGQAVGGLAVAGLTLTTKDGARQALGVLDAALDQVSGDRATLGATGNRLQAVVATVQATTEALAAANGRIKDVDVAEETSRMARSQILAQAGVSVLAQANQLPQLALKLIG